MPYSTEYFVARERWRDWRIEAQELLGYARVERGARVLEIGCGGGGLLRMLRARGAGAVGVDTLNAALRTASASLLEKSPLGPPFATGAGAIECPALVRISEDHGLPFTPNTFDAILGQHVIEHIAAADAALSEWHHLLKPNGRLALATPNAHYPDRAHFADADHRHIFSPPELRAALARAGFIVEACITIFPFLTRNRILRGVGVVGYNLFRRVPYFAERGRTILVSARKN